MNEPTNPYGRRVLAEKVLLKLIEIRPQMMQLQEAAPGPPSTEYPRLGRLAWEIANAFNRAEMVPEVELDTD